MPKEVYIAAFLAVVVYTLTRMRRPCFFFFFLVIIKFVNSPGLLFYIIVFTHPAYALPESVIDLGNRLICRFEDLCQEIATNHTTNLTIEGGQDIDNMLANIADNLTDKLVEYHWPNKLLDKSPIPIFVEYNLNLPT